LIRQEAAAGQPPGWVLAGGNLRPDMADTIAALQSQGGAYTLETVSPAGERTYERIESIRRVIPFEPSLAGLVEVGADPSTRIISFTVTEAGYYLDSHNRLETGYAELASDLAGTTRSTIYGALALILAERARRGSGGVTLMNCDNLRSNGERFLARLPRFPGATWRQGAARLGGREHPQPECDGRSHHAAPPAGGRAAREGGHRRGRRCRTLSKDISLAAPGL
jgi:mannitol-1-phosphate/altronate dehydrogenase